MVSKGIFAQETWDQYQYQNDNHADSDQVRKFHDRKYIFNTRYFINILQKSVAFRGKLLIKDIPKNGFMSCRIHQHIDYEGFDLKGQKFKFTDTFGRIQVQSKSQFGVARGQIQKKFSRWKSIALFPTEDDYNLDAIYNTNRKLIEIEIYPIPLRHNILFYDFSINTSIIPFKSITEFWHETPKLRSPENNIQRQCIWFWEYIIENGLDDVNAIDDITKYRILRVPQSYKDLQIIMAHPITYHFWRTIELMIRLPNFIVDDNCIKAHIEDYNVWLNVNYFKENKNATKFIAKFRQIIMSYCDCDNLSDIQKILHILNIFNSIKIYKHIT